MRVSFYMHAIVRVCCCVLRTASLAFLSCCYLLCCYLKMMPVLLRRLSGLNSIVERPRLACKLTELLQAVLEWDQLKVCNTFGLCSITVAYYFAKVVLQNVYMYICSLACSCVIRGLAQRRYLTLQLRDRKILFNVFPWAHGKTEKHGVSLLFVIAAGTNQRCLFNQNDKGVSSDTYLNIGSSVPLTF